MTIREKTKIVLGAMFQHPVWRKVICLWITLFVMLAVVLAVIHSTSMTPKIKMCFVGVAGIAALILIRRQRRLLRSLRGK
jgi:hypothetical protein